MKTVYRKQRPRLAVIAPDENLSDRIYGLILGRMQRGEIAPGERLIDTTLAAQSEVSRMPARDALMRLAHQGYLEQTTRGFVLPRLSHRDILDTFELRRLIEPHAAALAAQSLTSAQIASLDVALAAAQAAVRAADSEGLFRACEIMRNGWIAAVPSVPLRSAILRYMTHIQVVRMMTFTLPVNHTRVVAGYEELVAAFRARDGVAAAARLLRFVFEGENAYLAAYAASRDTVRARG